MTLIKPETKTLEDKLTALKRKEEEGGAQRLAEKLKLPYVNLILTPIDLNDLVIVPEKEARQGNLLVIRKTGQTLRLAVKNPGDPRTDQVIKKLQKQGFECRLYIASLTGLEKGWQQYSQIVRQLKKAPLRGVFTIQKKELEEFKKSLQTIQELKKVISSLSTTQLLAIIVAGAIEMKASDIHLEPDKEGVKLRYRIDGLLQNIVDFPQKHYHFLLSRIKTLSDMILNVHDVSQDGRFTVKISGEEKDSKSIDMRVSVLPSGYGESVVMRLLGTSVVKLDLNDLGIRPELSKVIENYISRPTGMILATGPAGSGKTTTLYACLNYVNKPGTKIITVEDPIEYHLEGITQTGISPRKGQTFAKALRAIVRQGPDVLMIGEIRDEESAKVAVQFALTGHIVFSTTHANEAAGAIPRLISMKVSPDSLTSSLNLLIAQRLVRKLCPDCKKAYQPPKEKRDIIKKILASIPTQSGIKIPKKTATFYQPKGCTKCHGLGYKGRIGVFEFLPITKMIKKLILSKVAAFEIQSKAQEEGMIALVQDGLLRAAEGITSLEEIERIIKPLTNSDL